MRRSVRDGGPQPFLDDTEIFSASSASVVRKDQQAVVPDDFLYFSGDDFTILEFIELGGHGVVTVSGNVVPNAVADFCREASAGNKSRARELDDRLQALNAVLFVESNPIPVKWALQQMGLISEGIRLPTWRSRLWHLCS